MSAGIEEAAVTLSWVGKADGRVAMHTSDRLLSHLRAKFSVFDKSAEIAARRAGYSVQPRKYAISPTGRFRYGLLKDVVSEIRSYVKNPVFLMDAKFREYYPRKMADALAVDDPHLTLQLRDYQSAGVEAALTKGCGILLYPTGAGKTLIMAAILKRFLDSTVSSTAFVVTLTHLVQQTAEALIGYGFPKGSVSTWTGTQEFTPSRVVICGPQIMNSAMKNPLRHQDAIEFMSKAEVFMVDEVHQCKLGNHISDFEKFIGTRHRFGFTGTLPENKIDEWNVIGLFGPVIKTVERGKLVSDGSITDVVVCDCHMWYRSRPSYYGKGMDSFLAEKDFVYSSEFRNATIAKIAVNAKHNCLVLVDRLDHGETLKDLISASCDKDVYFIRGSVEAEDREEIRKSMEGRDGVVCVAMSSIFSTGINISNLYYIVLANTCKAKVSTIQSIGRGVRTHGVKTHVTVFDMHDNLRYGNRLYAERERLYEGQGFSVLHRTLKEEGGRSRAVASAEAPGNGMENKGDGRTED